MNVYQYYAQKMGINPTHDAGTGGLKEYSLESHCGKLCKSIIDKAVELLALCDTHSHVVDNIRKGVTAAIEIVCFG